MFLRGMKLTVWQTMAVEKTAALDNRIEVLTSVYDNDTVISHLALCSSFPYMAVLYIVKNDLH